MAVRGEVRVSACESGGGYDMAVMKLEVGGRKALRATDVISRLPI